jgi:hypothetical protein
MEKCFALFQFTSGEPPVIASETSIFRPTLEENVKEDFEMVNKWILENTQLAIRKLSIIMFLSYYPKDCLELLTVTLLKWC